MHFTPEDLSLWFGLIASVVATYTKFKADVVAQEQRLTILEQETKYLKEFRHSAAIRMDNHDKQTETLIKLTSNIEYLTEKVEKIDKKLEEQNEKVR